jgi:hypothetical protein
MKTCEKKSVQRLRFFASEQLAMVCVALAVCCVAGAQQGKNAPYKESVTGHYEGSAKNKAGDVIAVSIDLTDKKGALSGTINSSHGDFPITGGTHQGETLTIEFEAGSAGTISVHITGEGLVGTWTAGDDGGTVDVKRVAAPEGDAKGKS